MTFQELMNVSLGDFTLGSLLRAVILAVACLAIIKIILGIYDRMASKMNTDKSISRFVRNGIKLLLLLVAVILVLNYLNIQATSLVALLSVAGLAVSLAVQNTLSNVAGSMQLLSMKPYVVGDFVEIAGESGTVSEAGAFCTKLTTIDNKTVEIPNSLIVAGKIINYSAMPERRVDLKISASYDAPVEEVKEALMEVVHSNNKTLFTPAPEVHVSKFGESSIEYLVRAWCANADYWPVYFDLLEGTKAAFDRKGIEMTYNHLNVHMVGEK